MSATIRRTANDKKAGMTRDELDIFVTDLDHAGIEGEAVIKARVGFKGQIQSLEATS